MSDLMNQNDRLSQIGGQFSDIYDKSNDRQKGQMLETVGLLGLFALAIAALHKIFSGD